MESFYVATPAEFSFDECLAFLRRSPREVLHRCTTKTVIKLLRFGHEVALFELRGAGKKGIRVDLLQASSRGAVEEPLRRYVRDWFDLDTDLKPFYAMAATDKLLKPLVDKHHGYRIVGQPDLFESLVWAVLGQQINLAFAYTLKQRFVQSFGEKMIFDGVDYYIFPRPATVSLLSDEQLLPLQFSRQKSKYTVAIAEAFHRGDLSREKLEGLSLPDAKEELMKIKGIGNWTANYALMKTFRHTDAFPLEDAGVHNAIKNLKGMKMKPSLDQVRRIFRKYKGWEAYATLYLWKSL